MGDDRHWEDILGNEEAWTADKAPEYAPRLLGYLDVLGWTELTERPDPHKLIRVVKGQAFIEVTGQIIKLRREDKEQGTGRSVRRSHFSDTVVFTCDPDPCEAWALVDDMRLLAFHLLDVGHYTRGGIVFGDVRHDEGVVYGPALVEAYRLERDVASYPRIVVSDAAAPCLTSIRRTPDEPVCHSPVVEDFDGLKFLEIFSREPDGTALVRPETLARLRRNVLADIERTRDPVKYPDPVTALNHRAKYGWMLRYIDSVLAQPVPPSAPEGAT